MKTDAHPLGFSGRQDSARVVPSVNPLLIAVPVLTALRGRRHFAPDWSASKPALKKN
jgi:hypothetical protein